MSERLKIILESAIKEEEHFIKFYKDAAEKTEVPSVKTVFLRLSQQEETHKEKLLTLDYGKLQSTVLPSIDEIGTEEVLLLTPLNEFQNLKEAFDYAINAEQNAQEMYRGLAKSTTDQIAKDLFLLLADEEMKHEEVLKIEVEKLFD